MLNFCPFGLGVLKDLDVATLPADLLGGVVEQWANVSFMEPWGKIDIGKTARYGVHFLMTTPYNSQEKIIRFFGGADEFPDEGGIIDRTFCALRVWAVVRPKEMEIWIGTQTDPELQKALTWLLNNPWGSPAEE